MKSIIAFTAGTIVTLIAASHLAPTQTHTDYHVQVIERTVHTDLDDLQTEYLRLAEELRTECLLIIQRQTGDPLPGITAHVDRNYHGDACAAADEALNGQW